MGDQRRPSEANLRRATSSAYYALFHCLARQCADLLVGGRGARRSATARRQTYRAIEHGTARAACVDKRIVRFPVEIQDFANAFLTMQAKRHKADYDPYARFTKSEVFHDIATARQAISGFYRAPVEERRAFCVWVLLKPPREG